MADNQNSTPLATVLGFAMRHARDAQGYGFARIDQSLAQAIVAEAVQRAALAAELPDGAVPDAGQVAEILSLFLDDLRSETRKAFLRRLQ